MFSDNPRATPIETIIRPKAANDNAPVRRDYLARMAEKSRATREFLLRAEQHLRDIRTLLLGNRPGSDNHD
jgi:hypothetical protein